MLLIVVMLCQIHVLNMQYSLFGSIMTIGAMLGAIISGKTADIIGRKGVSFLYSDSHVLSLFQIAVRTLSSVHFLTGNGDFRSILPHRLACNTILQGSFCNHSIIFLDSFLSYT